ncbi:HbrB-like-domain-containing protein [Rhizoctonia solani]|nr:HbrB-like-domain-containing protein [Rhizoctonia solani]
MAREMDRLGVSSGIPSANTSTLSLALTSQPLPSIAGGGSILNSTTSDTAPYQELHVHVLPLFNSENLKLPIEELNNLVRQHIQAVVSRTPSRALAALEQDVKDLVNMGMITLNAKLQGLEEETLLTRMVQVWGFFWDQVLPYLEGVFLPLQTEKILQTLARNPKTARPGSPGSPALDLPGVVPLVGCTTIDVRNVVLQSFRDSIIQPIWQKLYDQLVAMGKDVEASASLGDRSARLQQMLLVLSSASSRSILLSQSSQLSPMNAGEEAVTHLLRAILRVRALANSGGAQPHQRLPPPPALGFGGPAAGTGAAGMLFGAAPRDRRGRIAHKEPAQRDGMVFSDDTDGDIFAPSRDESETKDRQKERQFLESLKSPVPQTEVGPGSPENKKPTARVLEQVDPRGLGFATAMRAVI